MIAPLEWLNVLFAWILRATWQASVVILFLVAVQILLRRILPPQWLYSLWLLVLIRLALPFSLESPVSLFNYLPSPSIPRTPSAAPRTSHASLRRPEVSRLEASPSSLYPFTTVVPARPQAPLAAAERPLESGGRSSFDLRPLAPALPAIWIAGVAALFIRMLWANARLASVMRRKLPVTDLSLLRLARGCAAEVGLRQIPWLMQATEVRTPALFGFSVPRLLLPTSQLADFTTEELRHIFLHEFCHVRRRDIVLNWIVAMVQMLHWFNPLVWVAAARMRSDRELACDAEVLARLRGPQARDYGQTIIRLLEGFTRTARTPGLVGILEDRAQLKRRIRMISRFGIETFRWRWAGLFFAALLAISSLTDAATKARSSQEDETATPTTAVVLLVLDDETGNPISGATLNGTRPTDSRGRGEIRVAFPGFVVVRALGYVPRQIIIDGEESSARTLRMEKGLTIGGIVRDEEGRPIEGVEIQIVARRRFGQTASQALMAALRSGSASPAPGAVSQVTDAGGRWSHTEIPRDLLSLELHLFHREYASATYLTGAVISERPLKTISLSNLLADRAELVLKRGFAVVGTVTNVRGQPIEGAVVTKGLRSFAGEDRDVATCDRDGRFTFLNANAAATTFAVLAPGYVRLSKVMQLTPGMPAIRLILARGEILSVRVVDETGDPVPGALLTSAETGLEMKTDPEGRVLWNSAPERPFMVGVRARGFPQANEPVEAGDRENVIKLRSFREIRVSGRVVDAVTRQPLPEFQVLVSTRRLAPAEVWQDYRPAATGRNGAFNFALRDSFLPTGTVVQAGIGGDKVVRYVVGLKIKADGYFPDISHTVAVENGDASMEVVLEPGRGLSGVARLPGGEAASGARVYLCGRFTAIMDSPGLVRQVVESPETVTDRQGRFQFEPDTDAREIIVAHEMGFVRIPVHRGVPPLELFLQPWGRIEGVLRIGVRPGADEMLVLAGADAAPDRGGFMLALRTQTDGEGRFAFAQVPPGVYSIFQDWQSGRTRLLASGEAAAGTTLIVSLGGTGRPVIGRILLPPSGMPANSTWIDGILQSATQEKTIRRVVPVEFGPDGSFRIEDVTSGDYQLKIFFLRLASGTLTKTVQVKVPEMPGGRSDLPLDLGTINMN